MSNDDNKHTDNIIEYRLSQIEDAFGKFSDRIDDKLDKISKQFATKSALDSMEIELNKKTIELSTRLDAVENSHGTTDHIKTTILVCSLITNLFAIYNLFFH